MILSPTATNMLCFWRAPSSKKLSLCLLQSTIQLLVEGQFTQQTSPEYSSATQVQRSEDCVFKGCAEGQSQSLGLPALTSQTGCPGLAVHMHICKPLPSAAVLPSDKGKSAKPVLHYKSLILHPGHTTASQSAISFAKQSPLP